LLLATLASCGFHLQGALQAPAAMQRTYIDTADRHSPFYRELRAQLYANDIQLVDTVDEATATLAVIMDDTGQRVLSVSARNVPTEYEVYYSVQYTLEGNGKALMEPSLLTLTRDYTYDPTLVLGKAREEEQLREAIAKDLVRIVMKQLSTL
jgi:LPS-assembly lipoprotein